MSAMAIDIAAAANFMNLSLGAVASAGLLIEKSITPPGRHDTRVDRQTGQAGGRKYKLSNASMPSPHASYRPRMVPYLKSCQIGLRVVGICHHRSSLGEWRQPREKN